MLFIVPEIFFTSSVIVFFVWCIIQQASQFRSTIEVTKYASKGMFLCCVCTIFLLYNIFLILEKFASVLFVVAFQFIWSAVILQQKLLLCLVASTFFLILYLSVEKNFKFVLVRFEVLFLCAFAVLGLLFLLSANDWMIVYLSIELASISCYILSASLFSSKFSAEAGSRYFVTGALASGMILFGIATLYGITGTTNFVALNQLLLINATWDSSNILKWGLLLILAGFLFKVGAVPFHIWLPDVYEGSPLIVTFFFACLPKIAYLGFLSRLLIDVLQPIISFWQPLLLSVTLSSLFVGSLATLIQYKIKRFLAFGTITHTGYLLLALSTGTNVGVQNMWLYFLIYILSLIGVFTLLFSVKSVYFKKGREVIYFTDLLFLRQSSPIITFGFASLLASLAGFPWLVGFVPKFFLFILAFKYKYYITLVAVLLLTLISSFYYLRLVKLILFEPSEIRREAGFYMGSLAPLFVGCCMLVSVGFCVVELFVYWSLLFI